MTPKEKALDLCQKYGYLGKDFEYTDFRTFPLDIAKRCAIIAVDELYMEAKYWHDTTGYNETTDFEAGERRVKYWQQVKEEIEKL